MSRFTLLAAAALVAFSAAPAYAEKPQAAPAATSLDPQRLAAARDLMEAMQVKKVLRRSMDAALAQMQSSVLQQAMGDLPGGAEVANDPHFKERTRRSSEIMAKEVGNLVSEFEPRLIDAVAQAYSRQLTLEELKQASAFFRTPAGQKLGAAAPDLMADPSVTAMQMEIARAMIGRMPAIVKRIEDATRDLPLPKGKGD